MDNLTHSLVGLTSAKAGLERLSPYATTVCVISANAADADFVSLFFGDRWTLLQHHRGITHSIVGTLAIGCLVPLIAFAIEQIVAKTRGRTIRIRLGGLMIASMIAAITHPLMDWTNNYGVRPLLPWSGRWFYGDLVFIVDPYMWLVWGAAAFLLTSTTRLKTISWAILAALTSLLIVLAAQRVVNDRGALLVASGIWIAGLILLIGVRISSARARVGRSIAIAALFVVVLYWAGLAAMHHLAYANAVAVSDELAKGRGEKVIRVVAMPTVATPFRWQSVAETDRAVYRFMVDVDDHSPIDTPTRFEKPTGQAARLVGLAEQDRRAQVLLGFARFPIEKLADANCVSSTLVQFADLRYTEPGTGRGNFSVNIPIDCPAR